MLSSVATVVLIKSRCRCSKLEYRRGASGACATIEFALAMMSLALASLSVACLYCTWAMNYGILLCIARIVGLNLLVQVRKLMIGSNRDTTASRPTSQIIQFRCSFDCLQEPVLHVQMEKQTHRAKNQYGFARVSGIWARELAS